jgi:hypothetical protein
VPTDAKKPKKPSLKACETNESSSYLDGLHLEYEKQMMNYIDAVTKQMQAQARVELAEKTLVLTRDHFAMAVRNTEGGRPRAIWNETLAQARFVGARLSEASVELLKEHQRLTLEHLLVLLNNGQYRFRTNTPLREIHAALLKQPGVERQGDELVWIGGTEQQLLMRLRAVSEPAVPQEKTEKKAS